MIFLKLEERRVHEVVELLGRESVQTAMEMREETYLRESEQLLLIVLLFSAEDLAQYFRAGSKPILLHHA